MLFIFDEYKYFFTGILLMATNKHAIIRYQALDKCFSNWHKRFDIEALVAACNDAIYQFTGIEEGGSYLPVMTD